MEATGPDTARAVTVCFICHMLLPLSILVLSSENCKPAASHSFVIVAPVGGLECYFCLLACIFNISFNASFFLGGGKHKIPVVRKMSPCSSAKHYLQTHSYSTFLSLVHLFPAVIFKWKFNLLFNQPENFLITSL